MILKYAKLTSTAREPMKYSADASGYDLFSSSEKQIEIPPRGRACIPTGIAIALEPGYCGRLASNSSLSCVFGIEVGAGVIDADYRGTIQVILYNHSNDASFTVKKGDRIAQLLITKVFQPRFEKMEPEDFMKLNGEGEDIPCCDLPRNTKELGRDENKD